MERKGDETRGRNAVTFYSLRCVVLLSQSWKDNRLAWNVDEFEGLDMIWIPVKNMWTPDVALYNE